MNGEIIPVIYLIKERKRDYLYIIVFNVLIYRNEFINAMDHMYYPPQLSGLSETFSRELWKSTMHPMNNPPNKTYYE